MSDEVVTPLKGSTSTLDQAAAQLEGLLADADDAVEESTEAVQEEIEHDEIEDEADEAESDEAEEADEAPETDEDEGSSIESLAELAEALETPLDDLLASLRHTIKVNGESVDVTLSELQTGYQKGSDYAQQTEALKQEREAFAAKQAQMVQQFEQEHAQNADVLNTFEQAVQSQLNSEEMQQLRAADQQAYLLKRYELQDQLAGIQRIKQEAAQRYAQAAQQLEQTMAQESQERMSREIELRNKAIPDWSPERGQAIAEFLVNSVGFSMNEVSQAFTQSPDHRLLVMADMAMKYAKAQSEAKETTKKVKKAPKLVKPSARKPTPSRKEAQQLRGRLKKTGNVRDAAKVIESLM